MHIPMMVAWFHFVLHRCALRSQGYLLARNPSSAADCDSVSVQDDDEMCIFEDLDSVHSPMESGIGDLDLFEDDDL